MVGSAVVRRLAGAGCTVLEAGRDELDLLDGVAVARWFAGNAPDVVICAAAKVGGIHANNSHPVAFLGENLRVAQNVVEASYRARVSKLLFLGSSCVYPKFAEQPIQEDALLSGALEPTNEWYAVAKIAGIKLCEAYRREFGCDYLSVMPSNLYGPKDNFDLETSHVLPALLRKVHTAKVQGGDVTVWGSGTPRREFLHVDDAADAIVHIAEHDLHESLLNVGTGTDVSIRELVELIRDIVGFEGEVVFDASMPDGTPRKLMDCSRLAQSGWQARIGLRDGVRATYKWFLEHECALR
jgi:GDP-L-fucose synthase